MPNKLSMLIIFLMIGSCPLKAEKYSIINCTPFEMTIKYKMILAKEKTVTIHANDEYKFTFRSRYKAITISGIKLNKQSYFGGSVDAVIINKELKLVDAPVEKLFITCEFELEKVTPQVTVPLKPKKVRFFLIGQETYIEFGSVLPTSLAGGIEAESGWFDDATGLDIK